MADLSLEVNVIVVGRSDIIIVPAYKHANVYVIVYVYYRSSMVV